MEEEKMWERFRVALAELVQLGVNRMTADAGRIVVGEINRGHGQIAILLEREAALKYTAIVGDELVGFEIVGPAGTLRLIELDKAN